MRRVYFFIDDNGVQQGPVNIDFLMKHGIRPDAKIWFEGLPQWIDASDVSELKKCLRSSGAECLTTQSYKASHYNRYDDIYKPPFNQTISEEERRKLQKVSPKTWLFESILVTIFCCLPFGIVGIVYASKVNTLWQEGKYADSLKASEIAERWTRLGFYTVFALWILYVLISILYPVAMSFPLSFINV